MTATQNTASLWVHATDMDLRSLSNETLWDYIREIAGQMAAMPFFNSQSDYHSQMDASRQMAYLVLLLCEMMRRGHGVADHPNLSECLAQLKGLRKKVKRDLFGVMPEWVMFLMLEDNLRNSQEVTKQDLLEQDLPTLAEPIQENPITEVSQTVIDTDNPGNNVVRLKRTLLHQPQPQQISNSR